VHELYTENKRIINWKLSYITNTSRVSGSSTTEEPTRKIAFKTFLIK